MDSKTITFDVTRCDYYCKCCHVNDKPENNDTTETDNKEIHRILNENYNADTKIYLIRECLQSNKYARMQKVLDDYDTKENKCEEIKQIMGNQNESEES